MINKKSQINFCDWRMCVMTSVLSDHGNSWSHFDYYTDTISTFQVTPVQNQVPIDVICRHLSPVSISDKTFYCKISQQSRSCNIFI